MNVAIIEDDQNYATLLKEWIIEAKTDWNVDFFDDPSGFGQAKLSKYHVILSDYDLPGVNGLDLIKSVSKKTKAALALMSAYPNVLMRKEISQEAPAILSKECSKNIIDWLHYIEAKLRINRMVEQEGQGLNSMALRTNGHQVEIKDGVIVFGIKKINSQDKEKLLTLMKQTGFKVVAYFINGKVDSSQLSVLVNTYKTVKLNDGKLVFWSKGNEFAVNVIHSCTLDKIIDIYENLDNAINALK